MTAVAKLALLSRDIVPRGKRTSWNRWCRPEEAGTGSCITSLWQEAVRKTERAPQNPQATVKEAKHRMMRRIALPPFRY